MKIKMDGWKQKWMDENKNGQMKTKNKWVKNEKGHMYMSLSCVYIHEVQKYLKCFNIQMNMIIIVISHKWIKFVLASEVNEMFDV